MTIYSEELEGLQTAYEETLVDSTGADRSQIARMIFGKSTYFIGSGGTLAAAEFAADLHQETTGHFALALSPLRFVELKRQPGAAVVVFSASAKHPDTSFAVQHATALGLPVVLVTQRAVSELSAPLLHPNVSVLTMPAIAGGDGFLATRSVMQMVVTTASLYGAQLDSGLSMSSIEIDPLPLRQRVLVLYGHRGRSAAVDLETRLNELGLADVQLADYRNFAHGRHVGLDRRAETTTVVAMITPEIEELARRTLSALPNGLDLRILASVERGAAGSIQLLAAAMRVISANSSDQRIEPSRPKVTTWGRSLYHLPFKRMFTLERVTPAMQKARAAGFSPSSLSAESFYAGAFRHWLNSINGRQIDCVVLDYDGTCVSTQGRFEMPSESVQSAIIRILENGVPIHFATGRGDSLIGSLRSWVPPVFWSRVVLGLHNGAWMHQLSDLTVAEPTDRSELLETAANMLKPFMDSQLIELRQSASQLSITIVDPNSNVGGIARLVSSVLAAMSDDIYVASSAHSIDVIERKYGKDKVLLAAEAKHGNVLAIGDRGSFGGNDFDLLASTDLSISVDECSADQSRCWRVSDAAQKGPEALVFALSLLVVRGGNLVVDVKSVRKPK